MDIDQLICEFVKSIKNNNNNIEIYNEAALQYELAIFLREKCSNKYKIQLERNVSYFDLNKNDFTKKEIDIVIFKDFKDKPDYQDMFVIELKAIIDQNIARPVTVFDWIKDLKFLEELKSKGINCYSLFFTNEQGLTTPTTRKAGALLTDFRSREIGIKNKKYQKHKDPEDKSKNKKIPKITLNNSYTFEWKTIQDNLKYFIVKI